MFLHENVYTDRYYKCPWFKSEMRLVYNYTPSLSARLQLMIEMMMMIGIAFICRAVDLHLMQANNINVLQING